MVNTDLYFDYCATTPLHPAVREAMLPALGALFGNPSSMHTAGQAARQQVEAARTQVAEGIGADPDEIFFTSGATESNNLALTGVFQALPPDKNHLIISSIEHHATLHTADALAARGSVVTCLPVDGAGIISLETLEAAIRPETGLISIMMVNNEVGSIQDIAGIGEIARAHGISFHTDAVQAVNCFEINVDQLRVDLLSLSAHKIYGPKGIGALYVRRGTPIEAILHGGAQEGKLRPGTENVPGILGLGAAMMLRNDNHSLNASHCRSLRQELLTVIQNLAPDAIINGPQEHNAPHILSVSFPNVNGELLLFHLSQRGVAASMGSACTAESIEPSHVLKAMGLPDAQIEGTLRISVGSQTRRADIHSLGKILSDVLPLANYLDG